MGHPIFAWLVEYRADLYNRYQLGRDGKTTMQRLKGKRCIHPSVEFAQHIMFRVVGKVQGGMMKVRWMSGLYIGKRPGSEENLVMTEEGKVVRARAIKEMHKMLRMEDLDKLTVTPHGDAEMKWRHQKWRTTASTCRRGSRSRSRSSSSLDLHLAAKSVKL